MDEDFQDNINYEEDFYAYLNLPRTATPEEVNSAYRNLSRIYHPDKHIDDEKKAQAEILFNRTRKAYQVLSDPHQRAIYDSLGVKGIHTEGWEIAHRTKTPAEIREEYEQLAREREERRLQQKTNPRGNITVNINATDIFNSYDNEYDDKPGFPTIEVSGMSMSQSIEAPLTVRDTTILSGNLNIQNGVGSGGFMISGRRLINKGWFEIDAGAGNGPILGLKGSRNLTQRVFFNGGTTINFRSNGVIPGIVGTLAVQLDRHTVGYLTYNAGVQSSMATVVEHNTDKQNWQLQCLIGLPHCYVSASYTKKLIEHELKIRLAVKAGTFGAIVEYGAEKKVSKYSSVVASVVLGVPSGVTLKIKIIRSSQTYLFPIHLSEDIVPAAVFYATFTPIIVWFVVKKTIIEPMNAEHKQRNIDKAKELNKNRIAEKKKEAESAISLMAHIYERICNEENRKNGLIIVSASYGLLNKNSTMGDNADQVAGENDDSKILDVKIPLQCLVRDNFLILHASSKSDLPGFYDPCIGEDKFLRIEYKYRNNIYYITISDTEALKLPNTEGVPS